jgi:excisionase family DNA binding protein
MEKYISLKQAAEISGYHQDYLGQLIRKGKIKGKKIGRDWFILEEEIKKFNPFSKKWILIKDFFQPLQDLSKLKLGILFVLLIIVFIFVFQQMTSQIFVTKIAGDIPEDKIDIPERIFIDQKLIITGYIADEESDTKISIQPDIVRKIIKEDDKNEDRNWWQKLTNWLIMGL